MMGDGDVDGGRDGGLRKVVIEFYCTLRLCAGMADLLYLRCSSIPPMFSILTAAMEAMHPARASSCLENTVWEMLMFVEFFDLMEPLMKLTRSSWLLELLSPIRECDILLMH